MDTCFILSLKISAKVKNSAPCVWCQSYLTPDYASFCPSRKAHGFGSARRDRDVEYLVPLGEAGAFDYRVMVDARNTESLSAAASIGVPKLRSRLLMETPVSPVEQGEFFIVRVLARNLRGFQQVRFDLCFDPSDVEIVYVSRGTVFV